MTGGRLRASIFPACGRFPVVVFAHGYNGEARDFAPFAEFLAKNGIGAVIFTFSGGSTRDESGFLTTDMTLSTEQKTSLPSWARRRRWRGRRRSSSSAAARAALFPALVAEQHGAIAGLMLLYPAFCIPDELAAALLRAGDPRNARPVGHDAGGRGIFRRRARFRPCGILTKAPCSFCTAMKIRSLPLSYSEKAAEKYGRAELEYSRGKATAFRKRHAPRRGHALSFVRRVLAER